MRSLIRSRVCCSTHALIFCRAVSGARVKSTLLESGEVALLRGLPEGALERRAPLRPERIRGIQFGGSLRSRGVDRADQVPEGRVETGGRKGEPQRRCHLVGRRAAGPGIRHGQRAGDAVGRVEQIPAGAAELRVEVEAELGVAPDQGCPVLLGWVGRVHAAGRQQPCSEQPEYNTSRDPLARGPVRHTALLAHGAVPWHEWALDGRASPKILLAPAPPPSNRPRRRFHGVLAPRAQLRSAVLPRSIRDAERCSGQAHRPSTPEPRSGPSSGAGSR